MSFLCGIQLSSECEREGHAPLAPWVGLAFLFKHIYKKMLQPPILKPFIRGRPRPKLAVFDCVLTSVRLLSSSTMGEGA